MKYYIIAGEASGDLHGSNLIKALKRLDPHSDFRGWGGDLMKQEGMKLVRHYKDLAFMGFVEVARNLPTILRNIRFCKEDILSYRPDALILVDYPGFNLRIAKWAHAQRQRVIYYISPQVWAWKESRVKLIKACVDKMLVILPFEQAFYRRFHFDTEYVGHPLVEVIDSHDPAVFTPVRPDGFSEEISVGDNIVALLPGSRRQEILKKLPIMLETSKAFPKYHFIVAKAPGLEDAFYQDLIKPYSNVSSVANQTYSLLARSKAACVTSGTATLETALFGVPEVVCYKGSPLSYQIAKRLIKVKYISLVNLIMDKPVVKELIQDELTPANLQRELEPLLQDPLRRQTLKEDYTALKNLLGQGGHASDNAAASIHTFLHSERH